MAEDSISRRDALKMGIMGILGLAGVKYGVDRMAEAQVDLRNPKNFEEYVGFPPLFSETHLNYPMLRINEGAAVYKEPRKERSENVGENSLRVGSQTLMGTLGKGESMEVKGAYLALREADDNFSDKAWIRTVEHNGVIKNYDISRSWVIFDVKGVRLPESIKGSFTRGVACVPIEGVNVDFEGGNEPNSQNITFSPDVSFGTVAP